jgi:hypothetical protein
VTRINFTPISNIMSTSRPEGRHRHSPWLFVLAGAITGALLGLAAGYSSHIYRDYRDARGRCRFLRYSAGYSQLAPRLLAARRT